MEEDDQQELDFQEDHYDEPVKSSFLAGDPDQSGFCTDDDTVRRDFEQELRDLAAIEQDFFSFVLPWLKLIPEGASVPLEEVRLGLTDAHLPDL